MIVMTVPAIKNLLVISHAFIFLLTFDQLNTSWGCCYKLGRDRGQPASPRAGYGLLFCGRGWISRNSGEQQMQEQGAFLNHKGRKLPRLLSPPIAGHRSLWLPGLPPAWMGVWYPALHSGNAISIWAIWPCSYLPSGLEGNLPNFLYAKKVFFWLCTRD